MLCKGITEKKRPCRNKSMKNAGYCRYHTAQIPFSKVTESDFSQPYLNNDDPNNLGEFECIICCENVNELQKCELECGHDFCVVCVEKLKNACPICRRPVIPKQKEIKNKIQHIVKENDAQYKRDNEEIQMRDDIELARRLQEENRAASNPRIINRNNNTNEVLPAWLVQESIALNEINEYNYDVEIIEESIMYNESHEDLLLDEILYISLVAVQPALGDAL